MRFSFLLSSVILSAVLSACVSGQRPIASTSSQPPAAIALSVERWQQDIPVLKTVQSIGFENLHGNLVVKTAENGNVGIVAVEQRLGKKPEKAKVVVTQKGTELLVSIVYASDATLGIATKVDGHLKGRVDLAVFVPRHIALRLRTSYGDLSGRKLHNPTVAFSQSGRVAVVNTLPSQIESDSGTVILLPSDCAAAYASSAKTKGKLALIDVPTYCPLWVEVQAKSLTLGQTPVVLADGRWRHQFPNDAIAPSQASGKMHIDAPNAAVTLSLMQQRNPF
jgi:hypothetical protein